MEPIKVLFDKNKNKSPEEMLQLLTPPKLTTSKIIDEGRRKMMGGNGFKSFSNDQEGDRMRKSTFDYFRAIIAGDSNYVYHQAKKFPAQLKSLANAGTLSPVEYKTLSPWVEDTPSAGGYTVPPEWLAELARNLGVYGFCRKYFRQVGMSSNITNVATLVTRPSVNWTVEDAAIAASKPVIGQMVLTANKIAGLFPASNEVLEDSNIETWAVMQDIFHEQFQLGEDIQGLGGTGSPFNGILFYGDGTITSGVAANGAYAYIRGGSSSSGKTTFPTVSQAASATDILSDLINMLTIIPSSQFPNGKWFMSQNIAMAILSLRDSQFRFVADIVNGFSVETGLDGQPTVYFKGYPFVICPLGTLDAYYGNATAVTTPFLAFVDPVRSWLTMGIRGGFRIDMLREGTADSVSAATNDLQYMRMTERVAFGMGQPKGMVVLRTSTT